MRKNNNSWKDNKPLTKAQKKQVAQMYKQLNTADMKMKMQPSSAIGGDPGGSGAMSFVSSGYGSSASLTCVIQSIAQGTATNNRIGNKIIIRHLHFKGDLEPGDNTNYHRFIIFKWKQNRFTSQTTLANYVSAILAGTASSLDQHCSPVDIRSIKVLYDHHHFMHYGPIDGSTSASIPWKGIPIDISLKMNHPVVWDALTGNSYGSDIWMLALTNSTAVAHPGFTNGVLGLWYTDD